MSVVYSKPFNSRHPNPPSNNSKCTESLQLPPSETPGQTLLGTADAVQALLCARQSKHNSPSSQPWPTSGRAASATRNIHLSTGRGRSVRNVGISGARVVGSTKPERRAARMVGVTGEEWPSAMETVVAWRMLASLLQNMGLTR